MFWWWGIVFILLVAVLHIIYKKKQSLSVIFLLFGFFLTLIYPVISNRKYYHTFSPLPVVPFVYLDFLHSLKITRWPEIYTELLTEAPVEVTSEHAKSLAETREEFMEKIRPRMAAAYDDISKDIPSFFRSRARNIFLFWDKSHLYYYEDPFYPLDRPFIRTGNVLFLLISLLGMMRIVRNKEKSANEKKVLCFILTLLIYFTLPLSLLVPEERITLPVYAILTLFTPAGLLFLKIKPCGTEK